MTDYLHTFDDHINQACAEMAFAKAMGSRNGTFEEEVAEEGVVRGFHVFWSRSHDAPLRIPADPNPGDPFVFVTGELPHYRVHG